MTFRSSRWLLLGMTIGGWVLYLWTRAIVLQHVGVITEGEAIFVMSDLRDDTLLPIVVLVPLTLIAIVSFCVHGLSAVRKIGRS